MAARLHTLTETGEDCFLTSLRVRRGGAVAAAVAERLVRFCGANMHDPRHEATVLDAMETLATFLRFHAANHAASQLPVAPRRPEKGPARARDPRVPLGGPRAHAELARDAPARRVRGLRHD